MVAARSVRQSVTIPAALAVQKADSGHCAECLTENIFPQADTWEELRANDFEATTAYSFDRPCPERIRLHLVRDGILCVA